MRWRVALGKMRSSKLNGCGVVVVVVVVVVDEDMDDAEVCSDEVVDVGSVDETMLVVCSKVVAVMVVLSSSLRKVSRRKSSASLEFPSKMSRIRFLSS